MDSEEIAMALIDHLLRHYLPPGAAELQQAAGRGAWTFIMLPDSSKPDVFYTGLEEVLALFPAEGAAAALEAAKKIEQHDPARQLVWVFAVAGLVPYVGLSPIKH